MVTVISIVIGIINRFITGGAPSNIGIFYQHNIFGFNVISPRKIIGFTPEDGGFVTGVVSQQKKAIIFTKENKPNQ